MVCSSGCRSTSRHIEVNYRAPITGLRAYLAIRSGEVAPHRRWMVRNFALTFAAVTLRLYLPVSMISGVRFELAYPAIAWLCWLPNLIAAELLLNGHVPRAATGAVRT